MSGIVLSFIAVSPGGAGVVDDAAFSGGPFMSTGFGG